MTKSIFTKPSYDSSGLNLLAMIFANPKSIAVPSEFITLVPLQVLRDEKRATGGTRRKRAKKRKSRRR